MPNWGEIASNRVRQPVAPGSGRSTIWAGAQRGEAAPDELDEEADTPTPSSSFGYTPPEDESPTGSLVGGGLTVAALGGLALATKRNPSAAMKLLKGVARGVNTARYTSMLSGLAPIKSALGNIGAPLIVGAEMRSRKPMEAFLQRQTIQDWLKAIKDPKITGAVSGTEKWNLPGRVMGAGDYATREALKRGGLSHTDALRQTLQSPLSTNYGPLGKKLDSPITETLIPFRRTPFNQFAEGANAMTRNYPHKDVTAGMAATGGVIGAVTADEDYPTYPALAAAMAGRYGLPLGLAAALVRLQMGKSGGGIAGSLLPVSEYGFEESLKNPLRPLDPSYWGIVRAYRRAIEGR